MVYLNDGSIGLSDRAPGAPSPAPPASGSGEAAESRVGNPICFFGRSGPKCLHVALTVCLVSCIVDATTTASEVSTDEKDAVTIRVVGMPDTASPSPGTVARMKSVTAFRRHHPWIQLTSSTGLELEGRGSNTTLMQIAGRIAPHVMHVNLRLLDSYVDQGFLAPLDEYIERLTEAERLRLAPRSIWDAVTRRGPPDGEIHVYALPIDLNVSAVFYRRGLFRDVGLPDRPPLDWDELERFGRVLREKKGLPILGVAKGWDSSALLDFMPGLDAEVVRQEATGRWRCVFACPSVAKAAVQYAKLAHLGYLYRDPSDHRLRFDQEKVGMVVQYVNSTVLTSGRNPDLVGYGPLFDPPGGRTSSRIFCNMMGMFSDVDRQAERDAAWAWMRWNSGLDHARIRVETMVKYGQGSLVNPEMLRRFGFEQHIDPVTPTTVEALRYGLEQGRANVHGRRIDTVMREMNKPIGAILGDERIRKAVLDGEVQQAEQMALEHLRRAEDRINKLVYGSLSPQEKRRRNRVAAIVAAIVLLAFAGLFWMVMRSFRPPELEISPAAGRWRFATFKWAYLILLPAIGSVLIWQYYPLLRGTSMAFQDYRVMGGSEFVGMDNFAACLYDRTFWFAVWVSIRYALIFLSIGFGAPIVLAMLLQEAPFARVLFRTIFYLPAVLAGIVVILLWKKFYHVDGALNQAIGFFTGWPPWLMVPVKAALTTATVVLTYQAFAKPLIRYPSLLSRWGIVIRVTVLVALVGWLGAGAFDQVRARGPIGGLTDLVAWLARPWSYEPFAWLESRKTALFACILPTVWAGMGPGCLIYLAALKTVPEELYEAADTDGATTGQKILHVTLPGIKGLIIINFVGAFIGAFRSAGMILPMTGGGPIGEFNATEVVGLQIFYTAFWDLKFGLATAMAWILGAMLIGFTMLQLRKLSRMEYRTAQTPGS